MKAQTIECCHQRRHRRNGWPRGAVGGALFAVMAAFMPKCPICIAAWLGVLGLSGLVARVDPRVVYLAAALAVAVVSAAIVDRFLDQGNTKKGDET